MSELPERYMFCHPSGFCEPVKIRRSAIWRECEECGNEIGAYEVHAVAYICYAWHFCLKCVREDKPDA